MVLLSSYLKPRNFVQNWLWWVSTHPSIHHRRHDINNIVSVALAVTDIKGAVHTAKSNNEHGVSSPG